MERPQALTSFGILNVAIGITGALSSLAILFDAKMLSADPAVAAMRTSPEYLSWSRIEAPLGVVLFTALLAAGIGLLRMKAWARTLSIVCAVVFAVMACFASFIYLRFALPTVLEKAAVASAPEAIVMKVTAYAAGLGEVLGFIYPALLLYFMTRPHIRSAVGAPPWSPSLAGQ